MKKRTLRNVLFFIFLITTVTSCGNLFFADIDTPDKAGVTGTSGTLTGTITDSLSGTSRSAFPSLAYDEIKVYAKKSGGIIDIEGDVTDTQYRITGLEVGQTYTVTAKAFRDDTEILSGSSGPIKLTSDSVTVPFITLSPLSGETGSINLTITDSSSKNPYIKYSLDGGTLTEAYQIGNTFSITEDDVDSSSHILKIYVYETIKDWNDENLEVLLFQCTETVSVFPGLTTDTWVKNFTSQLTNDYYTPLKQQADGTVQFTLNDDLFSLYTMTSFFVDRSGNDNGKGTYWDPFNSIEKAFAYALATRCQGAYFQIKDGLSETITMPLQLDGKSWQIEAYQDVPGDNKGRAILTFTDSSEFVLENSTILTVTGIDFTGADGYQSGGDGGFAYINEGCEATFTNCTFTGGNTCGDGGAIANNGTCTLIGCTFSNNQAETAGGAIFSTGTLTISGTTTIENNITDENKYDFLSFYGNLTLDGTLNFIDSERFEFHKGNVSYAASSVTLVEGLSVTGSAISKIPLYYDSESNGGTSILNQCFFASGSGSKAVTYFSVPANGSTTYIINDSGEIKKNGTVSLTKNGETTQYSTLKEAFENISTTSTITLEADSIYEITSGYISISEADVTITVSGSGTATIKVNDACTSYVPFELEENATLTAQNIIFTSSSYIATYAGYFELLRDTSKATFTNCTFENGKCIYEEGYFSAGAIYCQLGELILDGCTFTNNKNNWNTTAQSGDANDIYLNDGIITLKNQNTFSGPIIIQMGDYHYVDDYSKALSSYIVLDESISLSEGKTTYADIVFTTVSDAGIDKPLVIDGLTESTQSWFPCTMPSGKDYFIDSDGKLQKYSEATTLYVGSNGSDSEPGYGYSAAKPFATLQHALGLCDTTAKTIWVAKDGSEVVSNGDWSVYGKNADIKVTDDGTYTLTFSGSSTHMLISDRSEISLTGIEFTRSDTLNGGGSFIYSTGGSSVTCTSCSFTTNSNASTGEGGAIFNDASLSLNNCSFNNCSSARTGGAIYNGSNGTLTLSDCTFSGNTASSVSNDIYHTGTSVTLEAGNIFDGGIKLNTGKMLAITESLDVGNGTIKITLPSYTVGTQILDGDGVASALSNNIIELADSNYIIDSEGKLQVKSTEPVVSITYYASEANPLSSLFSSYKDNAQSLIITIPDNDTLASQGHTLKQIPKVTIQSANSGSATITFAGKANTFYLGENGMTEFNFNNIIFERTDDSSGLFVYSYSGLTVTYSGCTFKDGKSDEGVISVGGGSENIFENCTFTNNSPRAITIAAYGKLTLKGGNSFGENDTIQILSNYQYKISLEAESVVKSGSTVKIYTESFSAIKDKKIFEGTYVSQAADFECTDPDYYFDSDGYCRKR